jgi:Aminoglycoside adenylyltransferase, C-terminal domain
MSTGRPTADAELNAVLGELVASAKAVLREHFVAAYLQGSFGVGDWDVDSDVDFLIAVDDLPEAVVPALQAMHARLYRLDSHWAQHLEGSYFPKALLRHSDPARTPLLFLDNTADTLVWSDHDSTLVVRWGTREHGIALAGPDARELIDPIAADDLRQEVRDDMRDWAARIFAGRYRIDNRWAQAFAVLSYCRMLHTLETGRIHSKPASAAWAFGALDPRWAGLIQRALADRSDPSTKVRLPADPANVDETLALIRYALALSGV